MNITDHINFMMQYRGAEINSYLSHRTHFDYCNILSKILLNKHNAYNIYFKRKAAYFHFSHNKPLTLILNFKIDEKYLNYIIIDQPIILTIYVNSKDAYIEYDLQYNTENQIKTFKAKYQHRIDKMLKEMIKEFNVTKEIYFPGLEEKKFLIV